MGILSRIFGGSTPAAPAKAAAIAVRTDGGDTRQDGTFGNQITGIGIDGVDMSLGARPVWRPPASEDERDLAFRQSGYMRRALGHIPKEATRKGWAVNLDAEEESDPAAARDCMADFDATLKVRKRFRYADAMARLHGGSVTLIVTDERKSSVRHLAAVEKSDLSLGRYATPLDPDRVIAVRALHTFTASEVSVYRWDSDPTSPTYREPLLWQISPRDADGRHLAGGLVVHASRVLYIGGSETPLHRRRENPFGFDDPVYDLYRDPIADLETVDRVGAIAIGRLELLLIKVAGLAGKTAQDSENRFKRKLASIVKSWSMIGAMILGEKDSVERHGFTAAGFGEIAANNRQAVAAPEGIPQVEFFGDTPSGLNTDNESGRQIMDRVVSSHQQEKYLDPLTWLYTIGLKAKGYSGAAGSFSIDFHSLHEPTDKEKAETAEIQARTDTTYTGAGVLSVDEVRDSRFGGPESPIALMEEDLGDLDDLPLDDDLDDEKEKLPTPGEAVA